MTETSRVVAPGYPHHIIHSGKKLQRIFFKERDYIDYLSLMSECCLLYKVVVWAYCLMPNHIHLIAVPEQEDGLRRAIGEAHRRHARAINLREGRRGQLWEGSFNSFLMDPHYTMEAARYIETNPVSSGIFSESEQYRWSSARAHINGRDDELVTVAPLGDKVDDWKGFLSEDGEEGLSVKMKSHERSGRPLGSDDFIGKLEAALTMGLRQGPAIYLFELFNITNRFH
jgi:putative transposase